MMEVEVEVVVVVVVVVRSNSHAPVLEDAGKRYTGYFEVGRQA